MSAPTDASWPLPFAKDEYADRLTRVRQEMERRGLDLLYVTSPPNLYYLLGYDSVWFDGRNPTGLAVAREPVAPLMCDTWDHEPNWPPTVQEGLGYGRDGFYYPGALDEIVAALTSRGRLKGRVGLEYWSWAPAGPALAELGRRLAAAGADVCDGSFAVDHVRLVKSPRELEYTRKALAIADAAHEAVRDALEPGVTEAELMGLYYSVIGKHGGSEPGIRMMVHGGPNSNHFHASASERPIGSGELLMVDMSATYRHYHGNTARAFSLGENPVWDDALRKLVEIQRETVAAIRPGDPTMKLQGLMDAAVDRVGLRGRVWWVGGYVLGATMPPDWVGHIYLNDEEGFEKGVFEPGFVANWEIQLEDIPAHQGVGLIDTMIMTETGIEVPARFPGTLTVV